jgi:hypothetical protein
LWKLTFLNFLDQRLDADVSPQTLANEEIVASVVNIVLFGSYLQLNKGIMRVVAFYGNVVIFSFAPV